jgi:hypothetical protein
MKIIIASLVFSFYFIEVAGIADKLKQWLKFKAHQRLKPLDCFICLSVWVAALLYFAPVEVVNFVFVCFSAGCIANFISLFNKIKTK